MNVLVLNCGSSTVKYGLYSADNGDPVRIDAGAVEVDESHGQVIAGTIDLLPAKPGAVGHRVVHGGEKYNAPVLIDEEVLDEIKSLSSLAPLHNPPAIEGIKAAMRLGVPQAAVFDTAFHQTMPEKAYRYALSESLTGKGYRRYGFHGISHHYVVDQYKELSGNENPNLITLHLGNGASAAAVKDGLCVDTSMGATPLEGLVMGTRGGDVDPGIILQALKDGMDVDDLENELWRKSGLIGISGDNDMRVLSQRDDATARLAVEMFCYRIRKYIGAYVAALGRVDGIVFTGGIGENSPVVRKMSLEGLEYLGIEIDDNANEGNADIISGPSSKVKCRVIGTNEELMIARETIKVMAAGG